METALIPFPSCISIACVLWIILEAYFSYVDTKKKKASEWSNYFQLPKPYNHFNSTTNTLGIDVKYEYKND